ncbi:efflux RND transporter periplasmic adaptor subunit [Fulvivirga maritima]|uniref:efflux RND transporter periplasmic adaptor subunit n=1 Tax=Fulvivirga maritima TaxID=2904247 RepID=UPI001F35808B|nr:efflux RND transporter periplasmic adaptor subunit [Fulvivirga maritima]UII25661.1 efflux RND transporter periplasmic adaptor subunit [Fulvivirga maritima]
MNQQNIFKTWLFFIFILCICSCSKEKTTKEPAITRVETITPKKGSWNTAIEASGVIGNDTQLSLSFKTGGLAEKVYTNQGDFVSKGALIAVLNTTELDAQIGQSNLKINKLKRDLARAEILLKDTIATLQQVQDLQTELDVAEEEKRSLLFNKSQTVLKAPRSGFIIDQQLSEGEYKNPGSPVVTIGSKDSDSNEEWTFTAGVTDQDRVHLKEGQAVTLTLTVFADKTFKGNIERLSSVPNSKTGTYEVVVSFTAPEEEIVYGLTGKLHIPLTNPTEYYQIPVEAFVTMENNLKGSVYLVDDNKKVKAKQLHILDVAKENVTVSETLSEETKIIITGKSKVRPGQHIEIVK